MKKQMKFKKGIIGVAVIVIAAVVFFSAKSMNNVVAANNSCNNATELQQYYNLAYDWSNDDKKLILTTKHGSFRMIAISHPEYFTNTFTKDSDGYYKIDNAKGTIDRDHKLTLTLKDVSSLNIQNEDYGFTMRLALSENDSVKGCLSMAEFNRTHSGATFESGLIEIELPKSSLTAGGAPGVDNSNYNRACLALREGKDPTGKINVSGVNYLKLYNASYREDYKALVPSCWQAKVSNPFEENEMIEIIRIALSSTYEQHHLSVGEGDTDGGTAWLINFDNVVKAAKEEDKTAKTNKEKHVFYTDGKRNFFTAKKGTKVFEFGNKDKNVGIGMKCRIKANSEERATLDYSNLLEHSGVDSSGNPIYNINANTQHYYAWNELIETVTYKWNYTKGNSLSDKKKTEVVNACTRICEEAVEVKYGPPVASKAGLCFEYQVQVTSRVKCKAIINAKPPKEPKVCEPNPKCNNVPGYIHQAGGNEEFAACIHECDGGKYTKACSDACYAEVYEGADNKTAARIDTARTEQLGLSSAWFKGYYKWSGGSIQWVSQGKKNTYARYYKLFEYGKTSRDHAGYAGKQYRPINGFKRRIKPTRCKDSCYFRGCSQTQYLNKDEAHKDYISNLKKYNAAIAKCKASASCTTKTATFTIKTDYKSGNGQTVTVDYPYTGNTPTTPETLTSSDNADNCHNPGNVTKDKDIILKYAGCYAKCGQGLQYQSRWSFPGSWINKKTGELSFVPKNGTGWTEKDDKFCIPLDAQDVNAKWWKYYYALYNANHVTSYNTTQAAIANCISLLPETVSSVTESDIDRWNIKGSTRNFGYYGWNFDISCFYALNTKLNKTTTTTTEFTNSCVPNNPQSAYKIRTVDLKNMFPDNSKASGAREPGFNWSSNANILASNDKVDPNQQVMPSVYAQKVQSEGYNIYNNNNIDYEFELTKEMIKNIKGNDRNYTNFTGNMVTRNGMVSYQSDVIRKGAFASSSNKVMNTAAIGCNNVENYRSAVCSNIQEEGK